MPRVFASGVRDDRIIPRPVDNAAAVTDTESGEVQSLLVNSKAAWRRQVKEWQDDMQEVDETANSDEELPESSSSASSSAPRRRQSCWLPTTLKALFGGVAQNPIRMERPRKAFTEETLYMELLNAEHSDEEPDNGEREGSGDDFEG
ncbi:hypothetical protein C8F01DRAFT_1227950 [Mycena amicta]|nr:hypothetical protein C8F01DRAFT_1227950 [Mycena amicta]